MPTVMTHLFTIPLAASSPLMPATCDQMHLLLRDSNLGNTTAVELKKVRFDPVAKYDAVAWHLRGHSEGIACLDTPKHHVGPGKLAHKRFADAEAHIIGFP